MRRSLENAERLLESKEVDFSSSEAKLVERLDEAQQKNSELEKKAETDKAEIECLLEIKRDQQVRYLM